jgi:predicted amidophosphoribosyltransferase
VFSTVFVAGVHDRSLRHAIARYKYGGERWWARVFARVLAEYLFDHATWFEEFDVIAGVPSYLGPGSRRSWDPVAGILGELAAMTDPWWEVAPRTIVKTCETPPLQGLTWRRRLDVSSRELRRSLVVPRPPEVAGARILVVDDVMTGGSTIREVARALCKAGAEEVAGLVLARPGSSGCKSSRPSFGQRPGRHVPE